MAHRGYAAIGLSNPKNDINVGSVMRAAGCLGVSIVMTTGRRYKRAATDTMAAYKRIPLMRVDDLRTAIPFDCVPVAVDIIDGAVDLETYKHPERAFYIFGPEDGTLGRTVTGFCRDVVKINTNGCLNLAMAVNVVLYDRHVKQWR
jgi:tRNA(Leu) C34 or U34 (ribose-2'-O)-methylase TrmL